MSRRLPIVRVDEEFLPPTTLNFKLSNVPEPLIEPEPNTTSRNVPGVDGLVTTAKPELSVPVPSAPVPSGTTTFGLNERLNW